MTILTRSSCPDWEMGKEKGEQGTPQGLGEELDKLLTRTLQMVCLTKLCRLCMLMQETRDVLQIDRFLKHVGLIRDRLDSQPN